MFKSQINSGLKWIAIIAFLLFSNYTTAQFKVIDVETFDKIIVSPHIEVIFKKGEKESVSIESMTEPIKKLNVTVKNNTLNVYLDGAKITANKEKEVIDGYKRKIPVYKGTVVKAVITYKNITVLDLRGEEKFVFESNLNTEKLRLKIYGESQVYINEANVQNFQVAMYGENYLEIKQGKIKHQKFTVYGESEVNTLNVKNMETKLTAYGDGVFQFNVSEKFKITSFGEATINYTGNPNLQKGIVIGETSISKMNI